MLYDPCIQGSSSFPLELGSNPKMNQLLQSIQQLLFPAAPPEFRVSEIINPEPFVRWGYVNTRWKGIKVIYICVLCFS
jgi:hypothetical protein